MIKKLNLSVFAVSFVQLIALVAPFIFAALVLQKTGQKMVLNTEIVLSLVGFFAIIIDWSSSTFLARTQKRVIENGGFATIILAKLICGIVLVTTSMFILLFFENIDNEIIVSLFLIIVALAIDPSWIYNGRLQLWVTKSIPAFRYTIAIILVHFENHALNALATAFLLTSIIYLMPLLKNIALPKRLSTKLVISHVCRFKLATFSDILTAAFTRLDVLIVAVILSVEDAFVYAMCRKIVLGIQSIIFASTPLLYLQNGNDKIKSIIRTLFMNCILGYFLGGILAVFIMIEYFNINYSSNFIEIIFILLLILPFGLAKAIIQFKIFFKNGKLFNHFLSTLISVLIYLLGIGILSFSYNESVQPTLFAALRVLTEVIYVVVGAFLMNTYRAKTQK